MGALGSFSFFCFFSFFPEEGVCLGLTSFFALAAGAAFLGLDLGLVAGILAFEEKKDFEAVAKELELGWGDRG